MNSTLRPKQQAWP